MHFSVISLGLVVLGACATQSSDGSVDTQGPQDTREPAPSLDADGDGYTEEEGDCAPEDPLIHPGAAELCDGIDNNCDEQIDGAESEDASSWFIDEDGDGYGVGDEAFFGCDPGDGYASFEGDCDDEDAKSYPNAPDPCDGKDNDCDSEIDEDIKPGWSLMTVDSSAGSVFQIDPKSGSATEVAPVDGEGMNLNTMDVRGDGLSMVQDANGKAIYQFDACTGELNLLGYTGAGNLCGISFGPDGVLYGLDSSKDQLVSIDANAGFATAIGTLGFDLGNCGLAYDCSTDTLYGADANANRIHTLDPSTGKSTGFVQTDVPFVSVGLEFDAHSGLMFASTGYELFTVNLDSGESSRVGNISGAYADDLAYHPACVE